MNAIFKPGLYIVLLVAIAGGVTTFVSNQNTIARLRSENQELSEPSASTNAPTVDTPDLAALRAQKEEADRLRAEIADLPKLRNEVGQLRRQAKELESLQNENRTLHTQNQNLATQKPVASAGPPPFIQRTAWVESGFRTPEATVQTFFAASARGDTARLLQCFAVVPPGLAGTSREEVLEKTSTITGFRINGTRNVSADELYVLVQTSGLDRSEPMHVKRFGNEWKFVDEK